MISIKGLTKVYAGGFTALKNVSLDIDRGEIFALLGPNGAGKTTLINIVCGIVNASGGSVSVDGYDIQQDWPGTAGDGQRVFRNGLEYLLLQSWPVRQAGQPCIP